MIDGLKPYPKYKDSGIEWLSKIPAHWEVRRGKALFRCIDVRSHTGQEELLTVSSERGVVPRRSANVTMFKAESYIGYKLCWPGDLVINSLWAWARGLAVSPYHGIVSSAYGVYRLRNGQQDNARFIHQLVRSTPFQWELQVRSKGIWVSRLQLTDDAFLCAPFPMPPSDEQTAIVRFLDWAEKRIWQVIRARQRRIELLEEYKQALINQALTGRIDVRTGKPHPKYKDSGIEWLGKIPAHWEVRRLKSIARIRYGLSQPPKEAESGVPMLRATNVSYGSIIENDLMRVDPNDVPANREAFLKAGDIIVVRSGAYTADSAIIPPRYEGAVAGYDMVVKAQFVSPNFLAYVLLTPYVRDDQLIIASMRSAQPHLNAEELGAALIAIPASNEQEMIVKFLDEQTRKIDNAISVTSRAIDLLKEFRTCLIADVVTGKLDVREVAAKLPKEMPEEDSDPLDEAKTAEDEKACGEVDAETVSKEILS